MGEKKDAGYIMLRNGLLDHLRRGWVDGDMIAAYLVMLRECDHGTGVWRGSALKLQAAIPDWSKATCVRVIGRLVRGQYIDTTHVAGATGNYDMLINNYEPTLG